MYAIRSYYVKEAREGDLVKPGRILIAPGDKHIEVEKRPLATIAHLSDAPPQNGHRPSADVLFESVRKEFQNHALGIIMTGMGRDGAAKMAELYREGSRTVGQDETSSIVYGIVITSYSIHYTKLYDVEELNETATMIFNSMDEMTAGATQINESAQRVSELARETNESLQAMERQTDKFKV